MKGVLFAFLLLLPAAHVAAQPVEPIVLVYRADTRSPEEIFQHGFTGRGQRMDLLAHTLGGACDEADPARASLWVSTSYEHNEAIVFGARNFTVSLSAPVGPNLSIGAAPTATVTILLTQTAMESPTPPPVMRAFWRHVAGTT